MAQKLKQAVVAGEYLKGVHVFRALTSPRVQDYRWAGMCYLHLGNLLEARRCLLTAWKSGDEAAGIDLATCLRFEGEFEAARRQLAKLDIARLSSRDAALALREGAILEQQFGQIARSATMLDEAWGHAVGASLLTQAAVAHSIGLVAAHQGNDVKAESYLRFAESHADHEGRVYLYLARATGATFLGKFEDAYRYLDYAQQSVSDYPLVKARLPYGWGLWFRVTGRDREAHEAFEQAIALARAQQQPEIEFFAQVELASLATETGNRTLERQSLTRAAVLVGTPRAQAYLDWRQGSALVRQGNQAGLEQLERARDAFLTGGCTREVVWVLLHLTEGQLTFGLGSAARESLGQAADAHVMLGAKQYLGSQLRGLGRTRKLLDSLGEREYERVLCTSSPHESEVAEVRLVTLEQSAIVVNGQRVRLQMRKTIEVLAYLLRHGPSSLSTLQSEVFDGVTPTRAKNYFHQVRLELRRLVPGLSVPYDAAEKVYRVQCEGVRLIWDLQQVRDALQDGLPNVMLTVNVRVRQFLHNVDSEWVELEREDMSRWIIRVGLETMDNWYSNGDYLKCLKLAERLIEVDPLDEGLHSFLIRATVEVSSINAARAVCAESRARFMREVGQVPQMLERLELHLQAMYLN